MVGAKPWYFSNLRTRKVATVGVDCSKVGKIPWSPGKRSLDQDRSLCSEGGPLRNEEKRGKRVP